MRVGFGHNLSSTVNNRVILQSIFLQYMGVVLGHHQLPSSLLSYRIHNKFKTFSAWYLETIDQYWTVKKTRGCGAGHFLFQNTRTGTIYRYICVCVWEWWAVAQIMRGRGCCMHVMHAWEKLATERARTNIRQWIAFMLQWNFNVFHLYNLLYYIYAIWVQFLAQYIIVSVTEPWSSFEYEYCCEILF